MRKKILLATIAFLFGTLIAWAGGTPSLPLNYQARIINGKFYVVRMLASPDPAPQGTFINSRGLRVDGAGTLYAISPAMAASPTIINSILGVAVDANGYLIVSLSGSGAGFPITNSVHVASGGTITWDSGGALVLASGSTFTPNTSIIPGTDNAIDLGSASKSWRNFYITGSINFLGSGLMSISGTPGVCGTAASGLGQLCLSSTGNRFVYSYNTGANSNLLLATDVQTLPNGSAATTQSQNDNSTKISTTAYTDLAVANAVAGVNPAIAVLVATTVAGDTSGLTYSNGVAGVGATLTGANNTAITIDGTTFTAVGQRLLVKNDTQSPSGAFNGIYSLTALQTAGTGAVFTRTSDYDTPSNMNNTGAIPVQSGTANGSTSWLMTANIVTVGTTPLTFARFTYSPTAIPTLGGNNTFTGSNAYGTPASINLSNATALPAAALPNPTASTLGGVESLASSEGKFINQISTAGVPSSALPDCDPLNLTVVCLDEEFAGSAVVSGSIGALGWGLTNVVGGTAAANGNYPLGWPWIASMRINTAATQGDGANLVLEVLGLTSAGSSTLFQNYPWDSYFAYGFGVSSGALYRVGYGPGGNAAVVPNGGAYVRFDETLKSITAATYTSGGSITGTATQTCNAAFVGGTATATIALTGTNTIAGSTAFSMAAIGAGYSSINPTTQATLTSGTATCSGTATVVVTNGASASGPDTTIHLCSNVSYREVCFDTGVNPDTNQHILRVRATAAGTLGLTLDANAEVTFCASTCTVTTTVTANTSLTPMFEVVSDTATTAEYLFCKFWRFKAWGLTFP